MRELTVAVLLAAVKKDYENWDVILGAGDEMAADVVDSAILADVQEWLWVEGITLDMEFGLLTTDDGDIIPV